MSYADGDQCRLDGDFAGTRHAPLSDARRQSVGVRLVHRCLVHGGVLLSDRANCGLHRVRGADAQNPRSVQRVKAHW